MYAIHFSGDHLAHYGRKGMKWGQNIFQTEYEGNGKEINENAEPPAIAKPSVIQTRNSKNLSSFPDTIRKKAEGYFEEFDKYAEALTQLHPMVSGMEKEEARKLYQSAKIQNMIAAFKEADRKAYDILIPASEKSEATAENKWTENDYKQDMDYIDDLVEYVFGSDIVNGELPSFEPAVAPEMAEAVEEKADRPRSREKNVTGEGKTIERRESINAKNFNALNNIESFPDEIQREANDHAKKLEDAISVFSPIAKRAMNIRSDEERKKLYRSSKVQDLINTIRDELDSVYDLLIPASEEAQVKEENKLTEDDRFNDYVALNTYLMTVFGTDAFGYGLQDEETAKHADYHIESASMQSINIAPIRGDAYMIHFSGEDMPDEYLAHYGIPRRSGRYPWGSGDRPYQGESQAFQDRATAGKISKYEKKRLKEENKAQVAKVKAAAAYAKAERKAAERTTKATEAADKQLEKAFDRQQKRFEAEEKLKDKQSKDEVKAINQLSGKQLTPSQQAQLALANMDSMSNQDLKNMLDRIDYQQKLSAIAAADKTRGQKIMSNLGNAVMDVAVKQLIPGAGKVFVEYGQSKLREALDLPETSKKDDNQNKQKKN